MVVVLIYLYLLSYVVLGLANVFLKHLISVVFKTYFVSLEKKVNSYAFTSM